MVRTKGISNSSKSLTVIAFVLAIAALYFGRTVFIPLALALVLSFLLTPFVNLLEKIRLKRVPSVLVVVVLALGLIGLATWVVTGQLVEIMVNLPDYKANIDAKIQTLHSSSTGKLSKAAGSIEELNKELSTVPGRISGHAESAPAGSTRQNHPIPVQVTPPASNVVQDLTELLGPLTGPMETAIIVIIFTMFMLVKREDLRNRAIRLAGRGRLSLVTQAFDDASRRLSRYLLLQCVVNAGYGSLFGLGVYLVGVPHAFLWGMIFAFLRFIPYVGTLAAAALPVAMAIAVFPGWRQAAMVFAIFGVLELAVSNFVEPLLYGSHTGISSLAILVAAVFWATLWGPVGLILSTPLTVCLVVLGRYVPQLNFLEVVLGDEPALPPEQLFYQRLVAMDEDEARAIAETYCKENGTEKLYERVMLPALRMAEQDRQIDMVDTDTKQFILHSVRDLVEEIGDRAEAEALLQPEQQDHQRSHESKVSKSEERVCCVPVRGGSDEIACTMLAQLMRLRGFRVLDVRAAAAEEIAAEVSRQKSTLVCVSCVPPFAAGVTRTLCRRLKSGFPPRRLIVGVWHLDGGPSAAQERLRAGSADLVVTTLLDALANVKQLLAPEMRSETSEPENIRHEKVEQ